MTFKWGCYKYQENAHKLSFTGVLLNPAIMPLLLNEKQMFDLVRKTVKLPFLHEKKGHLFSQYHIETVHLKSIVSNFER